MAIVTIEQGSAEEFRTDINSNFVGLSTLEGLTGILKSNGSGTFSAATAGTDYVIPSGNITGTSANITGTLAIANGGTGQTTAASAVQALTNALTSETLAAADLLPFLDASNSNAAQKGTVQGIVDLVGTAGYAKIATGSYVGTGTYGSANPCSLTFDFAPKMVIVIGNGTETSTLYKRIIMINPYDITAIDSELYVGTNSNSSLKLAVTWTGTGVSWYWYATNQADANKQLNGSGATYYYIAFK